MGFLRLGSDLLWYLTFFLSLRTSAKAVAKTWMARARERSLALGVGHAAAPTFASNSMLSHFQKVCDISKVYSAPPFTSAGAPRQALPLAMALRSVLQDPTQDLETDGCDGSAAWIGSAAELLPSGPRTTDTPDGTKGICVLQQSVNQRRGSSSKSCTQHQARQKCYLLLLLLALR